VLCRSSRTTAVSSHERSFAIDNVVLVVAQRAVLGFAERLQRAVAIRHLDVGDPCSDEEAGLHDEEKCSE
jgi:hypothetical protein